MSSPAILILEDGTVFTGQAYGALGVTYAELVFTTGMTGYQETLTDPSYVGQTVVMTSPHIGNTGVNKEDTESPRIWAEGIVVRDPARRASSWRSEGELEALLIEQNIVGISAIDTRALTRHLRDHGSMNGAIFSGDELPEIPGEYGYQKLYELVKQIPSMAGMNLLYEVGTKEPYIVPASGEAKARVAALDMGVKATTLQRLTDRGIEVHVLPHIATFADIAALNVDGVFFSNGPSDPATAQPQIELLQEVLRNKIPFFGICFGNQLLGRALGFETYKLKFGHRGLNQPVKNLATNKVDITVHNHGFAVDMPIGEIVNTPFEDGTFGRAEVSHVALNDSVVEGIRCLDIPAFSVQFHPEAAAGPHDAGAVFDQFLNSMTSSTPNQEQI